MYAVHGWQFPDADTFMASELQPDGTYQAAHVAAALAFVHDFSCAIDGGAHVGTWSRLLAAEFDAVIAVEPSEDTFEALVANMASFQCLNVDARRVALGDRAGFVSMTLDARNAARGNTGGRFVQTGGTIPVESIDDWALPTLGFLKLDVEGSEYAALCGARQTLARCRPVVLFENKCLWTRYGIAADGPAQVLRALGYQHQASVSRDDIWTVSA